MTKSQHLLDKKSVRWSAEEKPVWVQCEGFRCLAVHDRQGRWRMFFNDELLTGVISVIDTEIREV
jgi:hypothetical protein